MSDTKITSPSSVEMVKKIISSVKYNYETRPRKTHPGRGDIEVRIPDYSEAAALIDQARKTVPRKMLEFPREPNKAGGWTLEYNYIEKAKVELRKNDYCYGMDMEEIQEVLLFAEELIVQRLIANGYTVKE